MKRAIERMGKEMVRLRLHASELRLQEKQLLDQAKDFAESAESCETTARELEAAIVQLGGDPTAASEVSSAI